jgi:4-diphosphocytidyl-2-C-methyl-D-erythritol kinase
MDSITIKAYAKINLGLDVLRKREDGYHDVCMIMQSLDLHDTITIRKAAETGITIHTNLSSLPNDKNNLIYKAAALFLEALSISDGLDITLEKRIPVAAGLAGGSSDAAATLKGLNELYQSGLSKEELMKLGVKIGADVPYCILLGTALSEGIGEILTPLAPLPDCYVLLVKPDFSVSTKYVYENLKLSYPVTHPDIPSMLAYLNKGDLSGLTRKLDNILQTVTIKEYPLITDIKDQMLDLGAMASLMSGSGPTVFGLYKNKSLAEKAYAFFMEHKEYGGQVFLTKPYEPGT